MSISKYLVLGSLAVAFFVTSTHIVAKDAPENPLANIPLRNIGPAMISGRISDFAVNPNHSNEFYVATASGNLWKTTNNMTTWTPLFEKEGAYAIGVIEMAPSNSNVLWLGSGENNSQRSVAYGDGVYKSADGGKSWEHMGLKNSGHISQIWIDPNDINHVLVASQGPLWSNGGDRGLYKTTDSGKSWERILDIDIYTGVNEFVVDPADPNNIVATSYQRRRHVWTLINGGPGSGIHKTTDGGKTWSRISSGLPAENMGRIGIAMAPSSPNMLYAIVESNDKDKGVYRSEDFGQTWNKRSGHMTSSPQYYNELVVDPLNPERVYSLDTFTTVSEDGGKSFNALSNEFRHVDDHALWIDPKNTNHLIMGGDGGVYESWDRGQKWRWAQNLPLGQFYRAQPDNAEPFYNVCGGTQDNNSLCAPSRTEVIHGITNADWNIVIGGDGYKPQIDPNDPNIIYAQYQYGGLARYDRRTRERVSITPHPKMGENAYKWNWNSPLLLSPHSPTRLFYAAEKLFQTDDRGETWRVISPDLTRQIDRNKLKVMDRVWSVDTIAKNASTSMYGSIIALNESPLKEGLIYVGSDDGLISVTEDGGQNWRTEDSFRGVPDMSLVEDIIASLHNENVAYAVFDNHKRGDYKPYVFKTTNKGKSWKLISNDLPDWGSAHTIAEDHVDPNLLFVGTEFGLFVSQNGGKNWSPMKGKFPTIAVRDLEIQRRESDLVVGTFGRGIYILDDYSPLRTKADDLKKQTATLFGVKDSWLYLQGYQYGGERNGSNGDAFFTADNPAYGAVFSYYLRDGFETLQKQRREKEKVIEKEGGDTPYPSWDTLRKEDQEEAPSVFLEVKDAQGQVIRRVDATASKGFHRVAWDMHYPSSAPVNLSKPSGYVPPWAIPPKGPIALPGQYTVTLKKRQFGKVSALSEPQTFNLKLLNNSPEITNDREGLLAVQQRAANLFRSVRGASKAQGELRDRIKHLTAAVDLTPSSTEQHAQAVRALTARLAQLSVLLDGDATVRARQEPVPWSVSGRTFSLYYAISGSQNKVSGNHLASLDIAEAEYTRVADQLKVLQSELTALENQLESVGAPWTPGRIPTIE
ncbi:VPS10 domain-containing protein [Aliiglaciecola sp. M165]|uniref:VPS10 domain-containing protein n=1 Tax=Aliiglaciecola sp. M165 TaxID=2593649 RepID=UPI00118167BF|nr:glycosyl hydrolase [Aliiglaciecola sp. M165]TRY31748.1 glycosyl hydrolase [Aliiglaciecola sp. M165]